MGDRVESKDTPGAPEPPKGGTPTLSLVGNITALAIDPTSKFLFATDGESSGDGFTNEFQFTAGLLPLDPNSRFRLDIEPVPGQPGQMRLVFSPRFADRSYAVKSAVTLPGTIWQDLSSLTTTDDANTRTVTDLEALGEGKFYKLEISKPRLRRKLSGRRV